MNKSESLSLPESESAPSNSSSSSQSWLISGFAYLGYV